jgi:MscS family membrane protein
MFEQYISNHYLRAAVVILAVFIALRISAFIIERVILRFTVKTKTDIDDLIIEKSSKPITFLTFFIGLRIALEEISFESGAESIVMKTIASIIFLVVSYWAYSIINLLVFRGWKNLSKRTKSDIDDSLINLVHGILKVAWIIFTLLYLLNSFGIEIGPFLAGLGIGGIAIAFALQSSLSNVFGGISIILDKTVRAGDLVYLDDGTKGKIMHIGLRSTKIRTFDNELVIVPNGKLAESKIQNVALPEPKIRVSIPFSVAYGSDIEKVKKIVMSEIKKIKNLSDEPESGIKFLEMANSSLNFTAYFYIDSFEHKIDAVDEANTRIYNILNKNKIEIPFPQMDIRLKK